MSNGRYILIGQSVVACDDLMEWAKWFDDISNRRVLLTRVGPYFVSTVFLGLDHSFCGDDPPIVFETMVYVEKPQDAEPVGLNAEFLDIQERCATWLEAEAQHRRIVEQIREPDDPIEDIAQSANAVQSQPANESSEEHQQHQ